MNIIDLIFPKRCLQCGKGGVYICPKCLEKVHNPKLFCLECLRPSIDGATHIRCKRPYSIDFAYSPFRYEEVIRNAILRLKYSFASDIKNELSNVFCERIKSDIFILPKQAVITPIPLHRLRQNWRGFNQSQELARTVAEEFNWEYHPDILVRKKLSKPQIELKGRQRKENIRGAFGLNSKYKSLVKSWRPLIIFDDVLTTGSTIKEAGKVLKKAGARVVWGLTIAA